MLTYKGNYFKGRRWNGIGFDKNGEVVYELKNGCGYIKQYNGLGYLILEGEYFYGKLNGKVKQYCYDGTLIMEGEYLNDEKHGKVYE